MSISDNQNHYISLREASGCCSHSQDYLKLRARQGKLKAVKIGRNWVTTKEWLSEYLRQGRSQWSNKKKIISLFIGLGLLAFITFSFLTQPRIMLADIINLIPGRMVEIK